MIFYYDFADEDGDYVEFQYCPSSDELLKGLTKNYFKKEKTLKENCLFFWNLLDSKTQLRILYDSKCKTYDQYFDKSYKYLTRHDKTTTNERVLDWILEDIDWFLEKYEDSTCDEIVGTLHDYLEDDAKEEFIKENC